MRQNSSAADLDILNPWLLSWNMYTEKFNQYKHQAAEYTGRFQFRLIKFPNLVERGAYPVDRDPLTKIYQTERAHRALMKITTL